MTRGKSGGGNEKKLPLMRALITILPLIILDNWNVSESRWKSNKLDMKLLPWTQEAKPKSSTTESGHTLPGSHEVHCVSPRSECDGELDTIHCGTSEHAFSAGARTCKGQKSGRIIVQMPTTAILHSLALTGVACYWVFNVKLLLKILLSDKIHIVLMKTSGIWRLFQKSISKILLEIELFILLINNIFVQRSHF